MDFSASVLSERLWLSDQSWHYRLVERWEADEIIHILRVDICRNAYDSQSYLRGEVFDRKSNQWNVVVTIPVSQCSCRNVSYVKDADKKDFTPDAKQILKELKEILL